MYYQLNRIAMKLAFYLWEGSDSLQFEYYVLNYDCNKKKVIPFNIFNNSLVQENTEKAVKKYLRNPNKYTYMTFGEEPIYGFDAFVKELNSIIKWREWGQRQYEISVGDAFTTDCEKLEKWDCSMQCDMNIEMIAREVILQYKKQKKEEKDKNL